MTIHAACGQINPAPIPQGVTITACDVFPMPTVIKSGTVSHDDFAAAYAGAGFFALAWLADAVEMLGGLLKTSGADPNEFLSMAAASALLHHGPNWLSRERNGQRTWQLLGLNPRRSGRNLLFKRSEIIEHLEQQAIRRRGRPRSVRANVEQ